MKLTKLALLLSPRALGEAGEASWRDALPEDIRGDASLADVADVNSLASQFINAQKVIGQPSIRIPSENAGAEDLTKFYDKIAQHAPNVMPVPNTDDAAGMAAIYAKLGRPADADTYAVEGATLTPEMKKMAHDMNLTQAQFGQLYSSVIQPNIEAGAANAAALKQGRDALAAEWGYAFQTKELQAQSVLEKTGAPAALVEAAKTGQLNAETLRWMDQLVTSLGSEGVNIVGSQGGGGRMTPAEATAQINEMMMNTSHAYWNSRDPANAAAQKAMVDLQRIANPR